MEFKELTIEELTRGYTWDKDLRLCTCIFCGEYFEEGVIYPLQGRMVTAERAMEAHISACHGGVFHGLIRLDKQINGLSESQKDILEGMYFEKDNRELSEELGISAATVRTHKFNIQKMKREAKILLALLEQIENETLIQQRKHLKQRAAEFEASVQQHNSSTPRRSAFSDSALGRTDGAADPDPEPVLIGNSLHPFFTQYNLR